MSFIDGMLGMANNNNNNREPPPEQPRRGGLEIELGVPREP